jgi:acyl carrier protein
MVHIKAKKSLFGNIDQHLRHGGYLVIADFTSNIRTEIDLDEIGTYTITQVQWLDLFAEHHLQLVDCVEVSQEMSNSLYDPDFHRHQNPYEEIYHTPVVKGYHEMDNNLHLSLKKGLVSYVLMVLKKDERLSQESLLSQNRQRLISPTPYREVLGQYPELSLDSQGFFSQPQPEITEPTVETGDLEYELIAVVKREVKEILKYDEEINPGMTFEELGVKSLNAVEIIGALNTKLDLYLKTTLLFSYPTIEALVNYILVQYGQELRQRRCLHPKAPDNVKPEDTLTAAETAAELSTLLSEIERMSPQEMEALKEMLEGTTHA